VSEDTGPPRRQVVTLGRCAAAGVLAGLASLVPGVSGGTMILAAGVYPELVGAVADLTAGRFRRSSALRLLVTIGCALLAVVTVAGTARDAFTAWPVAFFALFLGLTLGGAPLLWRMASGRDRKFAVGLAAGALAVVLPIALARGAADEAATYAASAPALFAAGAIAAFAMVLPGISGSTLLLLMGMYLPFLNAVDRVADALGMNPGDPPGLFDAIAGVLPFFFGMVLGIAAAARLVRYFLGAHRQATLGVLFGLLLGATAGLWPFQTVSGVTFAPAGSQIITACVALAGGFLFTAFLGSGRRRDDR
jgi:putative membrane protein